ncbi:glycosyltransferase [Geothrix sp. PMB-07]|uniref:glycosyltransferase n=1 Tax=Geothrix sp. PMB-07 TaxID=3068640 RepID=UPI0027416BBF|nr:glycosyltransferase [Geothrix sp. PMB-07]WLT31802.1 glycosyltransferase [Geothrix sp. PMB-07]
MTEPISESLPSAGAVNPVEEADQAELDLREACRWFDLGNLPQAELFARRCLARDEGNLGAAALIEALREAYGLPPGFNLSERTPAPGTWPDDTEERFLVIKAWGYGFWSEGHHLAGQLLLAELTQRTPVMLWGTNCLFRREADIDASRHFFEGLSSVRVEDLPRTADLYPPKWTWDNLLEENHHKWEGEGSRLAAQFLFARPEQVVVSDFYSTVASIRPWIGPTSRFFGLSDDEIYAEIFQNRLRPVAAIADRAEAFHERHMQGRNWIGAHVRGSDKVLESPSLPKTNAAYFGIIDQIREQNPGLGVLLLTDSLSVVDEYRGRYGGDLLFAEATRTDSQVGVHLAGHDGVALGEEVYIDALLALKCSFFVGNQMSNVSLAVASLRDWPEGCLHLLGETNGRGENEFLHRRKPQAGPPCRLCQSATAAVFSRLVLSRHEVTYFECSGCGSLQTGAPHWLEEAYSSGTEPFEAERASRTLLNFLALQRLFELIGIRMDDRCADFGGRDGLFARYMRDAGYNFYTFDPQGDGSLCRGFSWEAFDKPLKLATTFEHAEPFVNPTVKWDALFATDPDFVVGTTSLYLGQGAGWEELAPECGRHHFFYAPSALGEIASRYGRDAYLLGGYFLFSRFPLSERALADAEEWARNPRGAMNDGLYEWMKRPLEAASGDNQHLASLAQLRKAGVRIALDGVFFRFTSGIARVWKNLLAEWSANGFGEFIVVLDRDHTAPRFSGIAYVDVPPHSYLDLEADRAMLQEVCDREGISLFASTYYTRPLTTRAALMVYDMIPEVMGFDLEEAQWREKRDAIGYARHFLSISHSTTRDLGRFYPKVVQAEVVTAYCGTDFRTPSPEGVEAFRARFGIDRPYFLISGVKTSYKNALLFFQAFERLGDSRDGYAIVCTNSRPVLEPEFAACVGGAKVHLLVLSDADLQCAYAGALALAYPSRYEGFGLPILEAMACSCPVITCENSSIGEVAGDAAIYVEPDDVQAMLDALMAVQDDAVRGDLILEGQRRIEAFSWRDMAGRVAEALTGWSLDATAEAAAQAAPPAMPVPSSLTMPPPAAQVSAEPSTRRLHIGGKTKAEGWEILDALPGPAVDHVCNANDLSRFADGTFTEVYASHVVEHFDYNGELAKALQEWYRVLRPGGRAYISVPDLDTLAKLLLDKEAYSLEERFKVMRMLFGGHIDRYDYHVVGLNEEFLASYLLRAGFKHLKRVPGFGLFQDTSATTFHGIPISLNFVAEK